MIPSIVNPLLPGLPEIDMQRIHTREILAVMFALLVTAAVTACGQKGDLYHPEEKQFAAAVSHT